MQPHVTCASIRNNVFKKATAIFHLFLKKNIISKASNSFIASVYRYKVNS